MFGLIKKRKPIIHAHWYVPLMDFRSDAEAFYRSIEDELASRQVPESIVERITFREGNALFSTRTYFRLRKERAVLDICAAPSATRTRSFRKRNWPSLPGRRSKPGARAAGARRAENPGSRAFTGRELRLVKIDFRQLQKLIAISMQMY
jgi:hypothetical protein